MGEYARTITYLAQKTVRERLAEVLILLQRKIRYRQGRIYQHFVDTRRNGKFDWNSSRICQFVLISAIQDNELIEVEGRKIWKVLDRQKLTKLGHVIL